MIVVEGPDGAGKTTLVNSLSEHLGLDIIPRACTSDGGPVDLLAMWVETNLNDPHLKLDCLLDRHPLISEPIYGPLIRGGFTDTLFEDPQWLTAMMTQLYESHMIIYCMPPLNIVLNNIERGHEGTTDHLRGVLEKGRAIWSQYHTRAAVDIAQQRVDHQGAPTILVWDYTIRGSYRDLLRYIGIYMDKVRK